MRYNRIRKLMSSRYTPLIILLIFLQSFTNIDVWEVNLRYWHALTQQIIKFVHEIWGDNSLRRAYFEDKSFSRYIWRIYTVLFFFFWWGFLPLDFNHKVLTRHKYLNGEIQGECFKLVVNFHHLQTAKYPTLKNW